MEFFVASLWGIGSNLWKVGLCV